MRNKLTDKEELLLETLYTVADAIDNVPQFGASVSTFVVYWTKKHGIDPVEFSADVHDAIKTVHRDKDKFSTMVQDLLDRLDEMEEE